MGPGRLHHLALGARDVERVAGFYRDLLELPELARHVHPDGSLRSIWLELDGAVLMIEHTPRARERVEGVGPGLFLLALRVEPAARRRLEEKLEQHGFGVESRTEFSSYLRDPEHNRVAISHHPRPADGAF